MMFELFEYGAQQSVVQSDFLEHGVAQNRPDGLTRHSWPDGQYPYDDVGQQVSPGARHRLADAHHVPVSQGPPPSVGVVSGVDAESVPTCVSGWAPESVAMPMSPPESATVEVSSAPASDAASSPAALPAE